MAPHAARLLVGPAHGRLLPLAAVFGALLMVLTDWVARVAIAPSELPMGALLGLLGAPVFLLLLARSRRC
jgi:iron complex transport system permease protein